MKKIFTNLYLWSLVLIAIALQVQTSYSKFLSGRGVNCNHVYTVNGLDLLNGWQPPEICTNFEVFVHILELFSVVTLIVAFVNTIIKISRSRR